MNFRTTHPLLLALILSGCTAETRDGLSVEVEATNSKTGVAKHDHADPTVQTFLRSDGRRMDLQKGFVNLVPMELHACASVASAATSLLGALLPAAVAHGDAGADGSIVDVSLADGTEWTLGELNPRPGRYCSVSVALVPVTSATAAPDEVDMRGASVHVAPCFYYAYDASKPVDDPDNARHYCFTLDLTDAAQEFTLALPGPLVLDSDHRSAHLAVTLAYDGWFDDLPLDGYPADGTTEEKDAFKAALHANSALKAKLRGNLVAGLSLEIEAP